MLEQTKIDKAVTPKNKDAYLKIIAEAITANSKNTGTLRKHIWSYLLEHYESRVDYRDFLYVIQRLLKEGKLINKTGLYEVEQNVYDEILTKEKHTKSIFESAN